MKKSAKNAPPSISFDEDLKKRLKDPKFRRMFEEESEKLRIAYEILLLRKKQKLTQKMFAEKLEISQSAVARMESGVQNLTIETLMKIGRIFGKKLTIRFV